MKGFFATSDVATDKQPIGLIAKCGTCGLYKNCRSPKMQPSGKGRKRILIVGEAPGKTEDEQGIQFIGESGQLLEESLNKAGIDFRRDCWVTNAVICRPPSNKLPPKAVNYCQPNLVNTVKALKPEVIIPFGGIAVKSLLSWLWKEDIGKIARWVGWRIPARSINAWVAPNWHPAYLVRQKGGPGRESEVLFRLFDQYIRTAVRLSGRPWSEEDLAQPNIECLYSSKEAARRIRLLVSGNRPIAFDYETDRLKPDHRDANIVSCSMSDGITTIAYPWLGRAIDATQEFIKSDIPKIASNIKFEQRWTIRTFGHGVNNWLWDTMLAAHVLDSRKDITSIKFQAFVLLGVSSWDEHIKPYLKSDNSNSPNRIKEIPMEKLLLYNGYDSLYEWQAAMVQMKQMEAR